MKTLLTTLMVAIASLMFIFPAESNADLVWTQPAWETTIDISPGGTPDRARGSVVDPRADRVQFKAYAQTTSTDVFTGDSSVRISFNRSFKLTGDEDTFSKVTLDGLAWGRLFATCGRITLFQGEFIGGARIVATGIDIFFPQALSGLPVWSAKEKQVTIAPSDSGFLDCNHTYEVRGFFEVLAQSGFFDYPGQSIADFETDDFVLEVGVTAGPCIPEPATVCLLALGGLALLRKRRA